MSLHSTIVVVLDQIERAEFFRRLDWPFLVRAWSKAINWERVSESTIRLDLAGIDGLQSIFVTRRYRGAKVFIGARDSQGTKIQTGAWEWDEVNQYAVCYRRVYKPELVGLLRERLAEFCCSTFLSHTSL